MIELILGGARSGKSRYAERCAEEATDELFYIATAHAGDDEMAARIAQHRDRRSIRWNTIEEPFALADVLAQNDGEGQLFLVDCLTLWLSNILFYGSETVNEERFSLEKEALLKTLPTLKADVLLVSNEVGQGIIPANEMSRRFVDESGWLHQELARCCQRVTLITAGLPQKLKG